jgi:hypothetical protein
MIVAGAPQNTQQNAAFSGTVLVENPSQVIEKKSEANVAIQQTTAGKVTESSTAALKLSIN